MKNLLLVIVSSLVISASYANDNFSFFGANGDLYFKKLYLVPKGLSCRHYKCSLFKSVFKELEKELIDHKLSDQEVLSSLKRIYTHSANSIALKYLKKDQVLDILNLAQFTGDIDSVQYELITAAIIQSSKREPAKDTYSLYQYYQNLKTVQRMSVHQNSPSSFAPLNIRKNRKRIIALKKLSARTRLYTLYTPLQIKGMAQIIKKSLDAMFALQGRVQLDYDGDDIWDRTEVLTPQEIYRLGVKLLHRDYVRLSKNPLFAENTDVQLIDLISAALEFGIVDHQIVSEILGLESLKIVQKGFFARHSTTFKSLGKLGILSTTNYGVFIVMAITLVESIAQDKRRYETYSPDSLF